MLSTMPDNLRIVFMGTPEFAVESLKAILSSGHSVVGVVTAPDKPSGRGKLLESSPVKKFAETKHIEPVLQPASLKDSSFIEQLASLKADLQIVVAFRMLPEVVWSMPPIGTINLHASLLPDYRGAAPINRAIINGEKITGISTFFIERDIDTGNIIFQESVPITPEMNAGELHDILMIKGAGLVVKTIDAVAGGNHSVLAQSEIKPSQPLHLAPKIFKEDCRIDWNKKGFEVHNFIRGLSPYPTAWTILAGDNQDSSLKIFRASFEITQHLHKPGSLFSDGKNYLKVAVCDGLISIENLQLAGKKRLDVREFLRGFQSIETYRLLV
jgi:methionyl-tRNA formyltransferase